MFSFAAGKIDEGDHSLRRCRLQIVVLHAIVLMIRSEEV